MTLLWLAGTAAFWGLVHTAAGPDHYLPFVVLARANRWRYARLAGITMLCGIGHVLSSIVLALAGVVLGREAADYAGINETRGQWATLLLLGVGLAYFVWGVRQSWKGRRHSHLHLHNDGIVHRHEHDHHGSHTHLHAPHRVNLIWALFIVFVLGPCESLIPLMMTAAGIAGMAGSVFVAVAFSLTTVLTMIVMVTAAHLGIERLRADWLQRHLHAVAGAVMVACALSILYLEPLMAIGGWSPAGG